VREVKAIYYTQKRSGFVEDKGLGLIHIYYGEGVGKTTSAVGLAVRAAGRGLQVTFVQFMKSGTSGEISTFKRIPSIRYRCPGKHPFILSQGPQTVHYEHASKALKYAIEAIEDGTQLLICDEILVTTIFKVLQIDQLLKLMEKCSGKVEFVMTGRYMPPELMASADYVTEFVQKKHPYYSGSKARIGIEY
jgi:cob(I)alamin adenosyltransferase